LFTKGAQGRIQEKGRAGGMAQVVKCLPSKHKAKFNSQYLRKRDRQIGGEAEGERGLTMTMSLGLALPMIK
jgi:hypothetical protein